MNFRTLSIIHKIQPFGHVFTIQGELEAKQNKTKPKKKTGTVIIQPCPPRPQHSDRHTAEPMLNEYLFIYLLILI